MGTSSLAPAAAELKKSLWLALYGNFQSRAQIESNGTPNSPIPAASRADPPFSARARGGVCVHGVWRATPVLIASRFSADSHVGDCLKIG